MARMNWYLAKQRARPSTLLKDETERLDDDRTARWLEKAERSAFTTKKRHAPPKRRRKQWPELKRLTKTDRLRPRLNDGQ